MHPGDDGNPAFNAYDLDGRMRLVFYPAVIGWFLRAFGSHLWGYDTGTSTKNFRNWTMKKLVYPVLLVLSGTAVQAQDFEMADVMRSNGQILLLLWPLSRLCYADYFAFLFMLERKIRRIENKLDNKITPPAPVNKLLKTCELAGYRVILPRILSADLAKKATFYHYRDCSSHRCNYQHRRWCKRLRDVWRGAQNGGWRKVAKHPCCWRIEKDGPGHVGHHAGSRSGFFFLYHDRWQ